MHWELQNSNATERNKKEISPGCSLEGMMLKFTPWYRIPLKEEIFFIFANYFDKPQGKPDNLGLIQS